MTAHKARADLQSPRGFDRCDRCGNLRPMNEECCEPVLVEKVAPVERAAVELKETPVVREKTHCINGHEYTPENRRRLIDGSYQCRTCDAERHERNRIVVVESGLEELAKELGLSNREAVRRLIHLRNFLVEVFRMPPREVDGHTDWPIYGATEIHEWLSWHGLQPVLMYRDKPL